MLRHFAESIRHFEKIPSEGDLRIYARKKNGFPAYSTFKSHFGSKAGTVTALLGWLKGNKDYEDILPYVPEEANTAEVVSPTLEGLVYLL